MVPHFELFLRHFCPLSTSHFKPYFLKQDPACNLSLFLEKRASRESKEGLFRDLDKRREFYILSPSSYAIQFEINFLPRHFPLILQAWKRLSKKETLLGKKGKGSLFPAASRESLGKMFVFVVLQFFPKDFHGKVSGGCQTWQGKKGKKFLFCFVSPCNLYEKVTRFRSIPKRECPFFLDLCRLTELSFSLFKVFRS